MRILRPRHQSPPGLPLPRLPPHRTRGGRLTPHRYRALRNTVDSIDDTIPGTFEITREGIVHDLRDPSGRHELTLTRLRRRLDARLPEDTVAHTGNPDDVTIVDWTISTEDLPLYDQ
ncbi:hypothetical protein ABZX85_18720 [Streptomyces sp. NPDC004539]|uniref:hypothetical protein n=1 Tax=Streptomyces sp. NPDC004539 TaxID=3154280 RepID=UPI0033B889CD